MFHAQPTLHLCFVLDTTTTAAAAAAATTTTTTTCTNVVIPTGLEVPGENHKILNHPTVKTALDAPLGLLICSNALFETTHLILTFICDECKSTPTNLMNKTDITLHTLKLYGCQSQ
jgi:hypothetical protein